MIELASPTEQDRTLLVQFLRDTYSLLDDLTKAGETPQGKQVLPADLLPQFQSAWTELKAQLPLERAENFIHDATDERLVWAGLYGEQLQLKMSVVARFKNAFLKFGTSKWLKKILDAIDRILDSIIAATGLDEALKELKDILSDNVEGEEEEET